MKHIPVGPSHFAIVDDEDFDRSSQKKWELTTNGYAYCRKRLGRGRREFVLMHRFILNIPSHIDADHINGNKLDNRKCNLRPATKTQNQGNRRQTKRNRFGLKGVRFRANRWEAFMSQQRSFIYLGRFKDPKEAARAYDAEATRYFGEFALTNKKMGLI